MRMNFSSWFWNTSIVRLGRKQLAYSNSKKTASLNLVFTILAFWIGYGVSSISSFILINGLVAVTPNLLISSKFILLLLNNNKNIYRKMLKCNRIWHIYEVKEAKTIKKNEMQQNMKLKRITNIWNKKTHLFLLGVNTRPQQHQRWSEAFKGISINQIKNRMI